jgi:hypothetical protein
MDLVQTDDPRVITGTIKVYYVGSPAQPATVPVKIYLGNIPTLTNFFAYTLNVNEASASGTIFIVFSGTPAYMGALNTSINGRDIVATIGSENLFIAFSGDGYPVHPSSRFESLNGSRGGNIQLTAGDGNDIHIIAGQGGVGSNGRDHSHSLACQLMPVAGDDGRNGGNGGNVTITVNDANYLYLRAGNGGAGGRAGLVCGKPKTLLIFPGSAPGTLGGRGGNGGTINLTTGAGTNQVDWTTALGGSGGTATAGSTAGTAGGGGMLNRN